MFREKSNSPSRCTSRWERLFCRSPPIRTRPTAPAPFREFLQKKTEIPAMSRSEAETCIFIRNRTGYYGLCGDAIPAVVNYHSSKSVQAFSVNLRVRLHTLQIAALQKKTKNFKNLFSRHLLKHARGLVQNSFLSCVSNNVGKSMIIIH